jgi:hypothetical protein
MSSHLPERMSSHIPEKKQSIMPNAAVWIALAVLAVVLAAIWFAVGFSGGEECPSAKTKTDETSVNCT